MTTVGNEKSAPGVYWYWQRPRWEVVEVDEDGWVTWMGYEQGGPSDEDDADCLGPRIEPPPPRDDAAICAAKGHRWKLLGENHRGTGFLFHCRRCALREISQEMPKP